MASYELSDEQLEGVVPGMTPAAGLRKAQEHGIDFTSTPSAQPVETGELSDHQMEGIVVSIPAEATAQIAVKHGVNIGSEQQ